MFVIDMDARPPAEAREVKFVGRMTPETFFDGLAEAGIDAACGLPLLSEEKMDESGDAMLRWNDAAMELAVRFQGRYFPVVATHPKHAALSLKKIEEGRRAGAAVVGDVQYEWLEDESCREGLDAILGAATASEMTVCIRANRVQEVFALAERAPALHILAHLEGNVAPDDITRLLQACPHASVSLSVKAATWNRILSSQIGRWPVERLVFGTGYPFIHPACVVESVKWELRNQPERVQAAIFSENARKLVGRMTI